MSAASKLIDELMNNAEASGNRALERRMADTAVWIYQNEGRIPRDNLAARQAFLEKAVWILLEINALMIERLRENSGAKDLWLPRGLDIRGDLKRFG